MYRGAGNHAVSAGAQVGQSLERGAAAGLRTLPSDSLDDVRVHTDAQAQQLAGRVDARAITVGQHIYFAAGEYQPATRDGRRLLVHELAHTLQSPAGQSVASDPFFVVERPDSPAERGAQDAAAQEVDNQPGTPTSPGIARSPNSAGGLAYRQPKTGAPVHVGTVVLFGAGENDVAGARRTAERLAAKIRAGNMTEDDYEILRQAGAHFKGRALTAFHEVIESSIKDRDVLAEVRRQAPPLPPGKEYVPPLLIAAKSKPDSVGDAERAGKRHADQLRRGLVSQELRDEIEAHIRFFEGKARKAYRAELASAIEDVKTKTERQAPGERTLLETRDRTYGEGFGPTSRFQEVHTEILPTSAPKTTYSFSIALLAEIRHQTSDSVSVEYYTDVSGSAEVGLKIPIKKIVEIKLGGGIKAGRKKAEKTETADVRMSGKRISRNFQVDELQRDVIRKTFRSVQDETRIIGAGSPGVAMVDPVERSLLGSESESQTGYRLTSKEDASKRDVWPSFTGRAESRSAAQELAQLLDQDGVRLANQLAHLVEAGF